ncbi:fagellar hook-basal body protein [Ruminiclostridium papyrosolvens DSM 2782]|uniref:Flagellar hook protein FlgE n=1 Tax=Ruminiclostridium papyrosolvens DSM 2782 TaxID=588581 RepID=F1THP2_9FIRM|nr:flagellar hook protein FlgE [Ruminiclostridium papyrosolvens]EGD46024.1 fagellar hook-basal body protein [Ruminiclostridium papyrosolvens DSM 2782]WES32824.1 flagellar hook protein FlgE [Ruminiclostridium papyrosolvens DSM 2782]
MMRSMFSGVSGLKAHQAKMDVIGNNVANVNTLGFKAGRVTFQEIFNQTLRGAGAPDAATARGGTNPMQIGLGIAVGSIDNQMTGGSPQRTDNPTDLSISGNGFFIVKGSAADTFKFTRAGNFGLDKLGNLVSGDGMNVYGWTKYEQQGDGTVKFDTEAPIGPINLYSDATNGNKKIIAAKATTYAEFSGNLNSAQKAVATPPATPPASDEQFIMPYTVFDSLGNAHEMTLTFTKAAPTGTPPTTTWTYTLAAKAGDGTVPIPTTGTLKFDGEGKLTSDTVNSIKVTMTPTAGANPFDVTLDFKKLTQFSGDSSVKPSNINGYTTGNLVTFNIGSDGMITGVYSNGQQQPLGLIALAGFDNPAGLQKVGGNLFMPTTNSGDFNKGVPAGSQGVGTLSPGTLEMSNVDLSREFTDMIVTQRGFQANSRIITTSDEMLQELVNLKR